LSPAPPMEYLVRHESVLAELNKSAQANTARIYRRRGVPDPVLGVSQTAIKALLKRLGVDHDLARGLWRTEIHEARLVATKVADPARLSREEAEDWLGGVADHVVADALAALVARKLVGVEWAWDWIARADEWASTTGWSVLTLETLAGRVDEALGRRLVGLIRRGIRRAPNRTRYAMNNALIAIGGSMPGLTDLALEVARAIGPVEVDHGLTGCQTPEAVGYISRMRTRASLGRMRASPRAKAGA